MVESLNPFGKQQSNIDLVADRIIIEHLTKCGVVYAIYSEEQTDIKVINEKGNFTVTYDPIDGNNVLDVNMSVASIFGIWNLKKLEGCNGNELMGAACTVYGSRTSLILYDT